MSGFSVRDNRGRGSAGRFLVDKIKDDAELKIVLLFSSLKRPAIMAKK